MNSRAKGKRGELELAKALREHGYDARRGVQYQGGTDSPDVVGIPGFHIECKFVENLSVRKAMWQSIRDAGDKIPTVMWKKSREEWLVVMRLTDWIEMEKKTHGDE